METTSLWSLLKKEKVEIPNIQRDYAQGRIGKEFIREQFLQSLINSLETKHPLVLDFVYGTKEKENTMWPLDGQQRLTTLWLLHWYIAVRTNLLSSNESTFENFTYETRLSSRKFCEQLCHLNTEDFNKLFVPNQYGIIDYIKDQTWYYNQYSLDPTIQGMLRTLGGTDIKNSKNEDITDGIEEFFFKENIGTETLNEFWQELIDPDCPITFVYMDMNEKDGMPLSDDLYVKMNARGKQLTDFENFKADLFDYAPDENNLSEKLINTEMASLFDNQWTDVFWTEARKQKVYNVDGIFFEFLRRFFLNHFVATSKLKGSEIVNTSLFKNIYGAKNTNQPYTGLNVYKEILTSDTFNDLRDFFKKWSDSNLTDKDLQPSWNKGEKLVFHLFPQYEEDKRTVKAATIRSRIVTFAICAYIGNKSFDKNKFEEWLQHFKEWLRFTWNITESAYDSPDDFVSCIRLLKEWSEHSGNILSALASDSVQTKSNYATAQIQEERAKARLMLGANASEWKKAIVEAEGNDFLRGNISCLLRHGSKDYVDDIECFNKKYSNVIKYFENGGLREEYRVSLTKTLIKSCHKWSQIHNQQHEIFLFDSSDNEWKWILNGGEEANYYKEVDAILLTPSLDDIKYLDPSDKEPWVSSANNVKRVLCNSKILNLIVGKESKWRIHKYNNWLVCLYPKSAHNNLFIFDWKDPGSYTYRRNELLKSQNITIKDKVSSNYYSNGGVLWGWNIVFRYEEYYYSWYWDNKIYLMDDEGNDYVRRKHSNDSDQDYYFEDMQDSPDINEQDFLHKLTQLANEYYN